MAVIKYSLETLLQDDRITDEEWLALGKALSIKNILDKNKNERKKVVIKTLEMNSFKKFLRNPFGFFDDENNLIIRWFNDYELSNHYITEIEQSIFDFILKTYGNRYNIPLGKNTYKKIFEKMISEGIFVSNTDVYGIIGIGIKTITNKYIRNFFPAILIISVIRKRLFISDFFKEIDDGTVDNNI